MCNMYLIDFSVCLYAGRLLFIYAFAYVQLYYYWTFWLLVCNKILVEYPLLLVYSSTVIEELSCLYAVANLLTLFIACVQDIFFARVQQRAYWGHVLLGCTFPIINI